jgi:putative protein-disulfide isomerase
MDLPILWYFVDPMCSWCWGFAPVFEKVKERYEDQAKVAFILGGLRPGGKDPVTQQFREDILHHWHEVQNTTGASFMFEGAMPDGFIYNTEIPSRAIVAVSEITPDETFPFYKEVQAAFYRDQVDVTKVEELVTLAEKHGVESAQFLEKFNSDDAKEKTYGHFQKAREFGVRGFPSLVLQTDERYHLITNGYRSFEDIQSELDPLLKPQG